MQLQVSGNSRCCSVLRVGKVWCNILSENKVRHHKVCRSAELCHISAPRFYCKATCLFVLVFVRNHGDTRQLKPGCGCKRHSGGHFLLQTLLCLISTACIIKLLWHFSVCFFRITNMVNGSFFGRPTFDCPWRHHHRKWGNVVSSFKSPPGGWNDAFHPVDLFTWWTFASKWGALGAGNMAGS